MSKATSGDDLLRRFLLESRLKRGGGYHGASIPESLPIDEPPKSYLDNQDLLESDTPTLSGWIAAERQATAEEFKTLVCELQEKGPSAVRARMTFLRDELRRWEERNRDIDAIRAKTQKTIESAHSTLTEEKVSHAEARKIIGLFGDGTHERSITPRKALENKLEDAEPFLEQLQSEHQPRARDTEQLLRFKLSVARTFLWRYTLFGYTEVPNPTPASVETKNAAKALSKEIEKYDSRNERIIQKVTKIRKQAHKASPDVTKKHIASVCSKEWGYKEGKDVGHIDKAESFREAVKKVIDS